MMDSGKDFVIRLAFPDASVSEILYLNRMLKLEHEIHNVQRLPKCHIIGEKYPENQWSWSLARKACAMLRAVRASDKNAKSEAKVDGELVDRAVRDLIQYPHSKGWAFGEVTENGDFEEHVIKYMGESFSFVEKSMPKKKPVGIDLFEELRDL